MNNEYYIPEDVRSAIKEYCQNYLTWKFYSEHPDGLPRYSGVRQIPTSNTVRDITYERTVEIVECIRNVQIIETAAKYVTPNGWKSLLRIVLNDCDTFQDLQNKFFWTLWHDFADMVA